MGIWTVDIVTFLVDVVFWITCLLISVASGPASKTSIGPPPLQGTGPGFIQNGYQGGPQGDTMRSVIGHK